MDNLIPLLYQIHRLMTEESMIDFIRNVLIDWDKINQCSLFYKTPRRARGVGLKPGAPPETLSLPDPLARGEAEDGVLHMTSPGRWLWNRAEKGWIFQILFTTEGRSKENMPGILERVLPFICQQYRIIRLQREYRDFADLDRMTGLYNQDYLKRFMANEMERCRRYKSSFSIGFIDMDNLKKINEAHGHLVGTELLKEVAGVLKDSLRKIDVVARFGGDEFVVVLLNTGVGTAIQVFDRVRGNLNSHRFLGDRALGNQISASFGISRFPGDGEEVDVLIEKADTAMYKVKVSGKDGIQVYRGENS